MSPDGDQPTLDEEEKPMKWIAATALALLMLEAAVVVAMTVL